MTAKPIEKDIISSYDLGLPTDLSACIPIDSTNCTPTRSFVPLDVMSDYAESTIESSSIYSKFCKLEEENKNLKKQLALLQLDNVSKEREIDSLSDELKQTTEYTYYLKSESTILKSQLDNLNNKVNYMEATIESMINKKIEELKIGK